jgi:hypothetical protein
MGGGVGVERENKAIEETRKKVKKGEKCPDLS